jgi:hypothetical protein
MKDKDLKIGCAKHGARIQTALFLPLRGITAIG